MYPVSGTHLTTQPHPVNPKDGVVCFEETGDRQHCLVPVAVHQYPFHYLLQEQLLAEEEAYFGSFSSSSTNPRDLPPSSDPVGATWGEIRLLARALQL
jgi:hypothetical protein